MYLGILAESVERAHPLILFDFWAVAGAFDPWKRKFHQFHYLATLGVP
jgi:hypothetical protein